jgi:glycerol-3-phosphate acyltransferase PlsX
MTSADPIVLSVDGHGGDSGEETVVAACVQALETDPGLRISICGIPDRLNAAMPAGISFSGGGAGNGHSGVSERLTTVASTTVLPMDAKPVAVLRRGQDSSMWAAFGEVAAGRADACVSGGNTAAMMTLGVKLMGLLPGIERPALMAHFPSAKGYFGMLDLGANLSVSAEQLVQFALMGSVAFDPTKSNINGGDSPAIGLLNVGHEDSKGHDTVKDAHAMLKELPLNYTGFIEGHDLFAGKVDVAVCDGFSGNLVLKSSEGLARMLFSELRSAFKSSLAAKLGAALASRALGKLVARFDPAAHNGAPLLGLNGVAVKSHGSADSAGLAMAILEAGQEARRKVPARIGTLIQEHRSETQE